MPPRRMRNIRVKCNLAARMRIFRRPSWFLIITCTCARMLDPKYLCQRSRSPDNADVPVAATRFLLKYLQTVS